MKRIIFVLLVMLALSGNSFAQPDSVFASPKNLVTYSFNFFENNKWDELIELIHPEAIEKFTTIFKGLVQRYYNIDSSGSFISQQFGIFLSYDSLMSLPNKEFCSVVFDGAISSTLNDFGEMPKVNFIYLGEVYEGELCHVINRVSADINGKELTKLDITTMKKYNGKWMLMWKQDIEDMLLQLEMM